MWHDCGTISKTTNKHNIIVTRLWHDFKKIINLPWWHDCVTISKQKMTWWHDCGTIVARFKTKQNKIHDYDGIAARLCHDFKKQKLGMVARLWPDFKNKKQFDMVAQLWHNCCTISKKRKT